MDRLATLQAHLHLTRSMLEAAVEDMSRSILMRTHVAPVTEDCVTLHRYVVSELQHSKQTPLVRAVLAGVQTLFPLVLTRDRASGR